jgi:hypothetical protein
MWKQTLSLVGCLALSTPLSAGSRDGGGLPKHQPVPDEDFAYHCTLHLENQARDLRYVAEGAIDLAKGTAEAMSYLVIPRSAWNHFETYDPFHPSDTRRTTTDLPPYNLDGHFLGLDFLRVERGWRVGLRANVAFEDKVAGVASFAYTDFTSRNLGNRVIASDPRPGHTDQGLDFRVQCQRVK